MLDFGYEELLMHCSAALECEVVGVECVASVLHCSVVGPGGKHVLPVCTMSCGDVDQCASPLVKCFDHTHYGTHYPGGEFHKQSK